MKKIRYDLICASKAGINKHPELVMKNDHGFSIIDSTPCSIADCWIFVVEDYHFPFPLPSYLEVIEE